MTMYGFHADMALANLRFFGRAVSSNIAYWSGKTFMVEASVARSFADYHVQANILRECVGVAKKTFENSDWKGFVNCNLSPEAKEAYAAWDIADSDVWDGLASYGEKGYKFTLTWNKQNSNWVATYVGTTEAGKNAGWAVTGFAKDPYNAARVLLFKVSSVLPEVWKDYKGTELDEIG